MTIKKPTKCVNAMCGASCSPAIVEMMYALCDKPQQCPYYEYNPNLLVETCKKLEQEPFINKPCISKGACQHHTEDVLDKIYADIQRLRGCSCSCSDGIIDDVEDILDKYKESEE